MSASVSISPSCATDLAPGKAPARGIIHVPRRFTADEWGGTETVILEISRQQQRAGLEPRIHSSLALSGQRDERLAGIPVKRHAYCYPFLGLSRADKAAMDKKGGNMLSLSLFSALLLEKNVRLYHAHALNRVGGMVRTAARLRRKPLVVSVHGGVFDVPAAESGSLLKPIEGKLEWGRAFGALLGARRTLQDADMVVFVGESEAAKARDELGHDRFAYLPNGVDCARFSQGDGPAFRAKHGIPQDAFLVTSISRVDAQKNQLLLVEAFAQFAADQPKARLVIMGPVTQPGYAESIRQLVEKHNQADRVHLLPGLRSHDPDMVNAYHASDVFVLPSLHEPFGIVVLEAWSAGCPVIASQVGGLRSLVRQDETGLFIKPEQADAASDLAGKLALLHASTDLRQRLGNAGREEARARYDWSMTAARLEAIYQQAEQHAARKYGRSAS